MNKRKLILWCVILLGLALQIGCGSIGRRSSEASNIYSWLGMTGTIILLVGCALAAEEKGYSRNLGLLGFLSILGVIVVAVLPRLNKDQQTGVSPTSRPSE